MIDADELKNRFRETVSEVDKLGRAIKVGRLKLSQQSAVFEMVEKPINRMMYQVVASVRGVDELLIGFPKTEAEILSRMDMLSTEGFEAASKAYIKINGLPDDNAPAEAAADADG